MSAPDRAALLRAKDVARVTEERGSVRDEQLLATLGCGWDELRSAIGIAFRWRRIDRCDNYLVPVPSRREGRRAA